MMNKEAIEQIQAAQALAQAVKALHEPTKQHLTLYQNNHTVFDLEQYMPNRRRARGCVKSQDIQSFAAYTKAHAEPGCSLFINQNKMTCDAVLNLGTPAEPGHADNIARLELAATPAYKALLAACQMPISQQAAAEYLEDWQHLITCEHEADDAPEGERQSIRPRIAIAALRSLTIEQARKDSSDVGNLSASGGSFASIAAKSKHTIPVFITLTTPAFEGTAARPFVMRLAIKTGEAKPSIKLSIIKHEEHLIEIAKELTGKLQNHPSLKDKPILIGEYTRAA